MQQLHVATANQIEPTDGGFQGRVIAPVNQVQAQAEQHAEYQRQQHFFCQAPRGVAGQRQAEQQREEHQQIEDQREIHESSEGRLVPVFGCNNCEPEILTG